jgi:WD40 repeat protein
VAYRAFISYSHEDEALARRLHAWLEAFRIPPGLEREGELLRPIFIDEAELGAASNLDDSLKAALDAAEALIVVASPAAARSKWVEAEVVHFKTAKPLAPCLALITSGRPFAADASEECFPLSMRRSVSGGVILENERVPLAPDVRKHGEDGSFLRLAAGLLKTDFGALVDRHAEREATETKRRRRALARAYTLPALAAHREGHDARALKYALACAIEADDPTWSEAPELKHLAQMAACTLPDHGVLRGCDAGVFSVSFSPDGTKVLGTGGDGSVCLWDVVDGRILTRTHPSDRACSGAVFSPDGSLVLSTSTEGMARLIDAETGKLKRAAFHDKEVNAGSFTPDGVSFVTVGSDHLGLISSVAVGGEEIRLEGHNDRVHDVAVSPDGRLIATASEDRTVRLWKAAEGSEALVLAGHEGDVRRVRFSADGRRLVSASWDRTARIWDVATAAEIARADGHQGWVWHAVFSPDGTRIVTASEDKTARIWDADSGVQLAVLEGHAGAVRRALFSPDGRRIATVSEDGSAALWDSATGARLRPLLGHEGRVLDAAFSPDGALLATASADATVRLWRIACGPEVLRLHDDGGFVAASLSGDGTRILAVARLGEAAMWDAGTGLRSATFGREGVPVRFATFSPLGDRLLVQTAAGDIRIWATREKTPPVHIPADGRRRERIAFSRDGSRIATFCNERKVVEVWETGSGEKAGEISDISFLDVAAPCPDGSQLAVTASTIVRLIEVADGTPIEAGARIFPSQVQCLDFNVDGTRLAGGMRDNLARVWEARTGRELALLEGHTDWVQCICFSPDGALVATGSDDKTARIWDVATSREIARLPHPASVTSISFDISGDRVLTASGEIRQAFDVHLWDIRPFCLDGEAITKWICRRLAAGVGQTTPRDGKDLLLGDSQDASRDLAAEALARWPHLAFLAPFVEPAPVMAPCPSSSPEVLVSGPSDDERLVS